MHHDPAPAGTSPGDPTANLTADLTAAGVSSDEANQIATDFQNLQTALTTTDPTLQAKIAADQAAIAKDGGTDAALPRTRDGHGHGNAGHDVNRPSKGLISLLAVTGSLPTRLHSSAWAGKAG